MPREPSKPKPFTASLAKGLRVLQCFSPAHPELILPDMRVVAE